MPMLVYLSERGMVFRQIWHEEQLTGLDKEKQATVLRSYKITEEDTYLSFHVLCNKYPLEG